MFGQCVVLIPVVHRIDLSVSNGSVQVLKPVVLLSTTWMSRGSVDDRYSLWNGKSHMPISKAKKSTVTI